MGGSVKQQESWRRSGLGLPTAGRGDTETFSASPQVPREPITYQSCS